MSPDAVKLLAMASQAHGAGRLAQAERFARKAVSLAPEGAEGWFLLGVIAFKTGRFEEAEGHLAAVVERDPDCFPARLLQSILYRRQGRIWEAADLARLACRLSPNDSEAVGQLGACLVDLGDFGEAVEVYRLAPDVAAVAEGLGIAYEGLGDRAGAIQWFLRASELEPGSEAIGIRLVGALLAFPDPAGAEECARRLPQTPTIRSLLARALMDQGRGEEAQVDAEAAVRLNPGDASILGGLGTILQSLGRIDEAGARFAESIAVNPQQGYAYSLLTHNRRITADDGAMVSAMEELEKSSSLPAAQLIHLEYGLGKAKQDLGEFEAAMRHFDEANRLAYGSVPYDRDAHADHFREIREMVFAGDGVESDLPIFVIGMMRSGTTLVEQILSSHSAVGAGGEQRFWLENGFSDAADSYVEGLRALFPNSKHVVDKMPTNYSVLGLIHAALPRARIIHVERQAVATCLSIYTTPSRSPIQWRHHKGDIVFAYREYEEMMRHWARTVPMFHVRYEDLVLDREATTRKMIEFCGLEWEDACLQPEMNRRSVVTPSVWQVRQPVYTSSLERWRSYEPWLGELAELIPH